MKYKALLLLLLISSLGYAQKNVVTAGIQFKPMLPNDLFNADEMRTSNSGMNFETQQNFGWGGGMVIRWGFTEMLSLETGINYVRRNYSLSIDSIDNNYSGSTEYRIDGYEVPIMGLIYIRLDRKWYMNAALGGSIDLFPRDFYSDTINADWIHETGRRSWIQVAMLANIGFEYRTESSGYFYIGGSFHRPFSYMYLSKIGLGDNPFTETSMTIDGSYLTIDLRYFFHDDPVKREKRKKNRN